MKYYLFSFTAIALSLAGLAAGMSHLNAEKESALDAEETKVLNAMKEPTPEPLVEIAPAEVILAPTPLPIVHRKPSFKMAVQKREPPKEKEMVCENTWHNSDIGGSYKNCVVR